MRYLDHIHACNQWDPGAFMPFVADGEQVGLVRPSFADELLAWPEMFTRGDHQLVLTARLRGFDERSLALQQVVETLHQRGAIERIHGELYPLTASTRERARCVIDRAAAPYFGVRAFGQHMNGFVRVDDRLEVWVAVRSLSKPHFPGKLDNMVAGGLPWGLSLAENLAKECDEEAGIPADLAAQAVPVGAISYCRDSRHGLKPDIIYCYDLELPEDFEPVCNDGEVERFERWPIERLMELVDTTDQMKLNCNLVVIDFLVRHGLISPEHPDYLAIAQGLRPRLP